MNKADRDNIALLQGSSGRVLNMRQTSAGLPSPQPPWSKPPTPITIPMPHRVNQTTNQATNPRTKPRGVGSPYDNMGSNKARHQHNKKEMYGNTTAARTLSSRAPDRPQPHNNFVQGSSNSSRRRVESTDVIEILDNEEDIGVPVQSDPMNMVDDAPFIPPPKKPKLNIERPSVHPFVNSPQDKHPSARKHLPQDGTDTIELEKQINNLESDTIEDFTDESSPVRVGIPTGNVREKVTKFEQKSGPYIDLRKATHNNVKGRMRPKGRNHDASATSSFIPNHSTISPHFPKPFSPLATTSSAKPGPSRIRIKEFFLGTEHKKSGLGYILHWDSNRGRDIFTIREDKSGSKSHPFQIMFNVPKELQDVKSMSFSPNSDLTIMEFATSRVYMIGLNRESTTFKMGDSHSIGKITLKFDTDHPSWSDSDYANFLKWVTRQIHHNETIGSSAARSVWEIAIRSAEIQQAGSLGKRKDTVEELSQDPRPAKRLAPDSVDTMAMDESTPPPVDQLSVSSSKSRDSASTSSRATVIPQPQRTRDGPAVPAGPLRRSSRQAASAIDRPPSIDLDEVILCYPHGVPGAVNITNADFKRLQPGEFLNDTLIEFGLKLWLRKLEDTNPELAKQIHVFNSFFYKKLNTRNIEDGYNSVRKWTSKFDLFSKKYIIVPINEHLHWYLAIIYHPAHMLNPPLIVENQSPTTRRRTQVLHTNADPPAKSTSSCISPTSTAPPTPEVVNEKDIFSDSTVENSLLNFDASCSITVTTEHSRSTTEAADTFEDVPSSPLSEIDSDSDKAREGNRRSLSPTVSDYNSGMTPPLDFETYDADSSSAGAAEVEQLFANDMNVEHTSRPSVVTPINFYGKPSKKAQGKQREIKAEAALMATSQEEEEGEPSPPPNPVSTTYIFTLDSLGARHPQAIKQLSRYLKLEAKDKRNLSETSDSLGKTASVPVQPNFCDCGLYLLHFAQKFVTDPEKYCHLINTRTKNPPMAVRQEMWEESKIADMRENMANDIRQLSVEWKKVKEEARKKEAGANVVEVIESTDGEVDIVETISATRKEKGKGKGPRRGPAKRLR